MAKIMLDAENEEQHFYAVKLTEENKEEFCFTNEKTLFSIARSELIAFTERNLQKSLL